MLAIYRNMFKIPDLRAKIIFTLAMFGVYRLGATIPVPGIDLDAVQLFQSQQAAGGIYGLLNLFSGGALEQFSVFALGIIPYITASIIMQLLTVVIPKLQSLQEEGESGRKVITQWTRYLTVMLALIQSTGEFRGSPSVKSMWVAVSRITCPPEPEPPVPPTWSCWKVFSPVPP